MCAQSSRAARNWSRDTHTFLVTEENRFAYAAVMQLRTGEATRPCRLVTISGPSGCGKSHLARHLIREALLAEPQLLEASYTAAEFAANFASASQSGCIPEFQNSMRRLQLLVIEDLQALESRPESQQQLLAVIDEIVARGGRVLLTSDKPVGELKKLPAKLVNRCHGGICAEIALPGPGTRTTLLSHFAAALQLPVPEDVLRLLAARLPVSCRELHGALVKLRTLADGNRERIDVHSAMTIIRELSERNGPSLSDIARAVSAEFSVPVAEMRSPGRVQAVVIARQTAMYLSRKLSDKSLSAVGEYYGGRNHATVLHACRRAAEQLEEDQEYAQRVRNIRHVLRSNGYHCEQSVHDAVGKPR